MSAPVKVRYVNFPLQYEGVKNELLPAVQKIFESGNYILGPELEKLEIDFANLCGTKYALGVANGTDALIMSMKALGIGRGDEVITVPNSFIASTASIVMNEAKPVFVDVREDYNINPELIESAITPKTKAIIPVHLTGRPADMKRIMEIARKHKLFVIEDCAQSVGAKFDGKAVGSFGDTGCFSLHPLKNLAAVGDGGFITTNDTELYVKLKKMRNHGLKNRDECEFFSFNSRLDNLQAGIISVKMKHLDKWTKRRREIADFYRKNLSGVVTMPEERKNDYAVYHTFVVQAENRDELQAHLLSKGIETKIHYPIPIHLQEAAKHLGYKKGSFPVTEEQTKHILSLPIYPELTQEQIELVVREIKNFYAR